MVAVGDLDPTTKASRLRLRIISSPAAGDKWNAQLELIRASGATYSDWHRAWYLWLDGSQLRPAALNALFTAAARYGTHVSVDQVGGDDEGATQ